MQITKRLVPQADGGTALAYPVTAGLAVDRRLLDATASVSAPVLLPGMLMQYPDGSLEMQYRVTDETLDARLARPFSGAQACAFVECLAALIDSLVANTMPLMNVRLEPEEVVMDGDSGACRFVFLPVSGVRPDLQAAAGFFRGVGARLAAGDDAARSVAVSYMAFFQRPGAFDVMAFATHLKQVAASVDLAVPNPSVPYPGGDARPVDSEGFGGAPEGDDSRTTVLSETEFEPDDGGTTLLDEEPDDTGTTVLTEGDDLGTTVLDEDEPSASAEASACASEAVCAEGAEGAGEAVGEDDPMSAPVAQSRPDRTGVLNPIDFQVAEGYEDLFAPDVLEQAAAGGGVAIPADSESEPEPEPEPAVEPADAPAEPEAPASSLEPAPAHWKASAAAPAPEPVSASVPEPAPAPTAAPVRPCRFLLTRLSTGERFEVRGRRFVVGKSKHSSFMVKGTTTVSRSHAIFVTDATACTIEDDNSRNGTFINNERIEPGFPVELVDGDTIRMSDENFAFEVRPA